MHRSPFTRAKRRTRRSRCLRPRGALKNRLPRDRSSRRWTRSRTRRRRTRRSQRCLVNRARAGLWHDHSRRWRNRSRWLRGRPAWHLHDIRRRLRRWRSTSGLCCGSRNPRRNGDSWRCRTRSASRCRRGGRCDGSLGRDHDHCRRPISGSYRSWRHHSRRRWRGCINRWLGRHCLRRPCLRFYRRLLNRRLDRRTRRRLIGDAFLLRDGAQHVSRPRNIRQVDLGLDPLVAGNSARSLPCTRRRLGAAAEMFPHQFRFVIFQRTGVRFLLRNTYRGQRVKNLFALDFQLTGQIIDSNLTHPLSFPLLVLLISCI